MSINSRVESGFLFGLAGVQAVLTSCAPKVQSNTALMTPVPRFSETQGWNQPEIREHFPHIVEEGLTSQEEGTIVTYRGRKVRWYDFAGIDFDPAAAKREFDFIERMAAVGLVLPIEIDQLGRLDLITRILERQSTILTIVPSHTPNPDWDAEGTSALSTEIALGRTLDLAQIRVVDPTEETIQGFQTSADIANLWFNIMIVYTSTITYVPKLGDAGFDFDWDMSTSIGVARHLTQIGLGYPDYLEFIKRQKNNAGKDSDLNVPTKAVFIQFTEKQFTLLTADSTGRVVGDTSKP